jgi:hypothetical protein
MVSDIGDKLSTQLSVTHSGLVHSIENYHQLRVEISQFVPEPQSPDEALWVSYYRKYRTRLEEAETVVILLSYTMVEAIANEYIFVKADEEQYEEYEQANLLDKWEIIPSLFIPGYKFPKGVRLYQDLSRLVDWRSTYTAPKPDEFEEKAGGRPGILPEHIADYAEFIKSCMSLPCRLFEAISRFDQGADFAACIEASGYLVTEADGEITITDPALLLDSSMYPE